MQLAYVFLGYFLGSMLFGYRITWLLKGVDIRKLAEDENPGTYNAFVFGGFWCGILTLLADMGKGYLPVILYRQPVAIAPAISSNCASNLALSSGLSINPASTSTDGIWVLRSTTSPGLSNVPRSVKPVLASSLLMDCASSAASPSSLYTSVIVPEPVPGSAAALR